MLTVEPMSGYDMKRFSEQSLAHFWHESFGSLYPRLRKLADEGLIRGRRESRSRAPDAVVYRLTPQGRRQFLEWMRQATAPERIRSEFLLKVFFGSQIEPESVERIIRDHERQQAEIRDSYAAVERMIRAELGDRPEFPYWLMSLRRGRLLTDTRLRWCRESLAMIEAIKTTRELP